MYKNSYENNNKLKMIYLKVYKYKNRQKIPKIFFYEPLRIGKDISLRHRIDIP